VCLHEALKQRIAGQGFELSLLRTRRRNGEHGLGLGENGAVECDERDDNFGSSAGPLPAK
jgi:hypothetical protein